MQKLVRPRHGFSLIELMVALLIVGILAALAYPSYGHYMRQARRAGATASLLQAAQGLERYYTENMTYVDASPGTHFPDMSIGGHYRISFASGPAVDSYTLTATPVRNGPQHGDGCGSFTLDHLGQKGVGSDARYSSSECWN